MRSGIQRGGGCRLTGPRRRPVLGRSAALILSLLQGGCLFFGVEPEECAEDQGGHSCAPGDGDGDGDSGGVSSSGGRSPEGGNNSGGSADGGDSATGGTAGLGGDPSGSGGDTPAGGGSTGGAAAAGGQANSGGSGGAESGGQTGAGGSHEIAELAAILRINEIYHSNGGYVELFNRGDESLALADVAIATAAAGESTPDLGAACDLTTAEEISPQGFLLVQVGEACFGDVSCFSGCSFLLEPGAQVYLLKSIESDVQIVNEQDYPSPAPLTGESYQAIPDGATAFVERTATPAAPNAP